MRTVNGSLQNPQLEAPHVEETSTVLDFIVLVCNRMDRHERLPRCIEDHYRLSLSHGVILWNLSHLSVLSYCRIRRILPQHLIGA